MNSFYIIHENPARTIIFSYLIKNMIKELTSKCHEKIQKMSHHNPFSFLKPQRKEKTTITIDTLEFGPIAMLKMQIEKT